MIWNGFIPNLSAIGDFGRSRRSTRTAPAGFFFSWVDRENAAMVFLRASAQPREGGARRPKPPHRPAQHDDPRHLSPSRPAPRHATPFGGPRVPPPVRPTATCPRAPRAPTAKGSRRKSPSAPAYSWLSLSQPSRCRLGGGKDFAWISPRLWRYEWIQQLGRKVLDRG